MRIILTHEQADFDALASLLGARLLDERAVAVLPRRMNRNVRAFITLYGLDLPFTDPRDLGSETIEAVTLVDTQSMVSIKGMTDGTSVRVIDHHPRREGLPPNWEVNLVETGATATLLVEALRDENEPLTTLQATLLLLGIYEDTGSLTYTRTNARDLRAAAYLLEQGASLRIASDFINHPLTPAQQMLYDQLRANANHLHIHGHTIIIAQSDAQEVDEELSTIVHKLRDLLDPDALFVLARTRGGVQLIARSTTDNIDVAEIASQFGGGGHERAAAGLIRGRELPNVAVELARILPDHVRPAITVAQLMSRGPQVLEANTSAEEAARRMQRYGYEGYPVVQNGKVVGLLTRRAVDRAIAHKLNLTADSLMEAGEVTICPENSIEDLQRLMTETGWGQIPVLNCESGKIIGIVTRTDLLKTLAPQARLPSRQNLSKRLERTLPPSRLALLKAIAQEAHKQHSALYIVGGFVRDLLLERPSLDFDLVVEGDAIALARALSRRYGGRVTSHARFGTAKWHIGESGPASDEASEDEADAEDGAGASGGEDIGEIEHPVDERSPEPADKSGEKDEILSGPLEMALASPQSIDLISARTEFYTHPTALPTVERGSIKLDLHRRDFTFNTLALRLDGSHYGELHDYWGGLNDLRHGLVRVLHSLSFVDDPTRMLRAVRFEQRFNFRIEERTLELLKAARSLLDRISGDRIRHELDHILIEPNAARILARLNELELLETIHPGLKWDNWLQSRLEALPTKQPDSDWELNELDPRPLKTGLGYTVWLLRLPQAQAEEVCGRLKLSSGLTRAVVAACQLWNDLPTLSEASPSQVAGRLDDVPILARYAVYMATSDIRLRRLLQAYATRWRKVAPTITGHDLKQRQLPPGPAYREILSRLRQAWLDEEIHTPEEEAVLLEDLLSAQNSGRK